MQIYGPYRVSTTQSASNVQSTSAVDRSSSTPSAGESSATSTGPVDQLDLSQAATASRGVENAAPVAGEGIRFDRVAEIRRQIADGNYDTPERMDAALDRFLDLLG